MSCCNVFSSSILSFSLILNPVVRMEELEQIKKDYEKALEEGVNSEKEVFNVERLPSQLNS